MFEQYNDVLSVEQLMQALGIGKNTAYDLLNNGDIQAFRIGKIWKISKEALEDYVYCKTR